MLFTSRKLAAVALTTLAAVGGLAGAAGAVDPLDELGQDPCVQNPDMAQCQGDDDDDDGGLEACEAVEPEDCAQPEEPEVEGEDEVPTAEPADPVGGSPNFTG